MYILLHKSDILKEENLMEEITMINEITWEFIRKNRTDYNRLQKLALCNDEVFEAIQIIQRMMENIPKSKVVDILDVIENHYEIYQQTKHKTTAEKQQAMALLVALAGGAIAETQMYDKGFKGSATDIFTEDTLRLINE